MTDDKLAQLGIVDLPRSLWRLVRFDEAILLGRRAVDDCYVFESLPLFECLSEDLSDAGCAMRRAALTVPGASPPGTVDLPPEDWRAMVVNGQVLLARQTIGGHLNWEFVALAEQRKGAAG
jgi:hypothetical protein